MSYQVVSVSIEEFAQLRDKFPQYLDDVVRAASNNIRRRLPGLVRSALGRFQTGELSKSFQVWADIQGIRVSTDVPQAKYVFEGVAPHTIDQRAMGRDWPMRWDHAASKVPAGVAWKVNHPGQPARIDVAQMIEALVLEEVLIALGGLIGQLEGS